MGSSVRMALPDGSYVDWSLHRIKPDKWRPHGVRYRLSWVQNGDCRVLFDNHHGKRDHCHLDGVERDYDFTSPEILWSDFLGEIRRLGGQV